MRLFAQALVVILALFGAWHHFSETPETVGPEKMAEFKPASVRAAVPPSAASSVRSLTQRLQTILDEKNPKKRYRPFLEELARFHVGDSGAYLEAFDGRGFLSEVEKEWNLFLYQWGRHNFQAAWNHPRVAAERRLLRAEMDGPLSPWEGWFYAEPAQALAWLKHQATGAAPPEIAPGRWQRLLTRELLLKALEASSRHEDAETFKKTATALLFRLRDMSGGWEGVSAKWQIPALLHRRLDWKELMTFATAHQADGLFLDYLALTCPEKHRQDFLNHLHSLPAHEDWSQTVQNLAKADFSHPVWPNRKWASMTGPLGLWTNDDVVTGNLHILDVCHGGSVQERQQFADHLSLHRASFRSLIAEPNRDPLTPVTAVAMGGLGFPKLLAQSLRETWPGLAEREDLALFNPLLSSWSRLGPEEYQAFKTREAPSLNIAPRIFRMADSYGSIPGPTRQPPWFSLTWADLGKLPATTPWQTEPPGVNLGYRLFLQGGDDALAWLSRIGNGRRRYQAECRFLQVMVCHEEEGIVEWAENNRSPHFKEWHKVFICNELKIYKLWTAADKMKAMIPSETGRAAVAGSRRQTPPDFIGDEPLSKEELSGAFGEVDDKGPRNFEEVSY